MFRHPVRIPIKSVQEMEPGVVLRELDPSACGADPVPFHCSIFSVEPASRTGLDRRAARECWFIAEGRGVLASDAGLELAQAGDAFLFDSGLGHSIENTGARPLLVVSIWWSP
jgi:mannose-6-phosphate isomerase-like protein (cupin superfamily)